MKKKKQRVKSTVIIFLLTLALSITAYADEVPDQEEQMNQEGFEALSEEEIEREGSAYENNQIIIAFKEEYLPGKEGKEEFLSDFEGITVEEYFDGCALVSVDEKGQIENVVDRLAEAEPVAYLQPNYTYSIAKAPSSEPAFGKQWGIYNDGSFSVPGNGDKNAWGTMIAMPGMDIKGKEAWEFFPDGGREVIVAAVDTGIDITHEDLKGNLWVNEDEVGNGKDSDGNGYKDDLNGWNFYDNSNDVTRGYKGESDHGTHVAGIIAAENNGIGVAGVASNVRVKLMPIKVLGGEEGIGNSLNIMKAIKYAQENGADICNMSFGLEQEDPLLKNTMKNSRMLFVVAAGNGIKRTGNLGYNTDLMPNYPAASDLNNIISVANMNFSGNLDPSSCYGPASIDVGAPGTYIYSTLPGNKYGYMTGTSMAAPMVSGAAAMIYSYYEGITPHQVREILLTSVRKSDALYGKVATGGMIDVYGALTAKLSDDFKKGTPPVIKTKVKQVSNSYKKVISTQIADEENNLQKVYYAKGEKNKSYFETEGKGTEIPVKNYELSWDIPITSTGYYTIYASDTMGNTSLITKFINIKTIKLNAVAKTMKQGQTFQLMGILTPEFYSGTIIYTSSNSSIASVHRTNGKITALKKGKVKITARVEGGKTAVCEIIVN